MTFQYACAQCGNEDRPIWWDWPDGRRWLCSACAGQYLNRPQNRSDRYGPQSITLCTFCREEEIGAGKSKPEWPEMLCTICLYRWDRSRILNNPLRNPNPRSCTFCRADQSLWYGPKGPKTLCYSCFTYRQMQKIIKRLRSSKNSSDSINNDAASNALDDRFRLNNNAIFKAPSWNNERRNPGNGFFDNQSNGHRPGPASSDHQHGQSIVHNLNFSTGRTQFSPSRVYHQEGTTNITTSSLLASGLDTRKTFSENQNGVPNSRNILAASNMSRSSPTSRPEIGQNSADNHKGVPNNQTNFAANDTFCNFSTSRPGTAPTPLENQNGVPDGQKTFAANDKFGHSPAKNLTTGQTSPDNRYGPPSSNFSVMANGLLSSPALSDLQCVIPSHTLLDPTGKVGSWSNAHYTSLWAASSKSNAPASGPQSDPATSDHPSPASSDTLQPPTGGFESGSNSSHTSSGAPSSQSTSPASGPPHNGTSQDPTHDQHGTPWPYNPNAPVIKAQYDPTLLDDRDAHNWVEDEE